MLIKIQQKNTPGTTTQLHVGLIAVFMLVTFPVCHVSHSVADSKLNISHFQDVQCKLTPFLNNYSIKME